MRSERVGRTTDEAHVEPPLVVDVDGSLIGGDLLIEGIARLLSASPLGLFALPFRLYAAMAAGTLAGLIAKYVLDRRFVFRERAA